VFVTVNPVHLSKTFEGKAGAYLKELNSKCRLLVLTSDIRPGVFVLKLITALIYGFRYKLECLSPESLYSLV
jgi:hypothetical protein